MACLKVSAFPCLVLVPHYLLSKMLLHIKATVLEAEEIQPVPRYVSLAFLLF